MFATLDEQLRSPGVILPIAEVPEVPEAPEVAVSELSVGTVQTLWDPSDPAMQQVGRIADETSRIEFTVWR